MKERITLVWADKWRELRDNHYIEDIEDPWEEYIKECEDEINQRYEEPKMSEQEKLKKYGIASMYCEICETNLCTKEVKDDRGNNIRVCDNCKELHDDEVEMQKEPHGNE